jgi:hypothetical protein
MTGNSIAIETWCDYHEHKDEAERKACEESKPDDWDLRLKRMPCEMPNGNFGQAKATHEDEMVVS